MLKKLPYLVRVANLKAINLATGISTHDSCTVLQILEEFIERMRLLNVHLGPILS